MQRSSSESRPTSPVRSSMPPFYTVRLSEKPIFLRRTTIRPPSMDFVSQPLEPEPLPPSPKRKATPLPPSPKRQPLPRPVSVRSVAVGTWSPVHSIAVGTSVDPLPVVELRPSTPEQSNHDLSHDQHFIISILIEQLFDESIQTSPPPIVRQATPPPPTMKFDIGIKMEFNNV